MKNPEVTLDELKLLLAEDRAFCMQCSDDFSYALDLYKIEVQPEVWEIVILCADCSVIVYRFLARLRGVIPK